MFKLNMIRERPQFPARERIQTKAGRLVVRNLPFKVTEDDVKTHFTTYGNLDDVQFVRRNNVFTGCAFVQFDNKLSAAKALAKTSGRDFKGRTIIVDWAVSKDRYQQMRGGDDRGKWKGSEVEVKEELSSDEEKPDVKKLDDTLGSQGRRKIFESESEDEIKKEDSSSEETDADDKEGSDDDEEEEDVKPDVKPRIQSEKFLEIKRKHQEEDNLNLRTLFVKNIPFSVTNKDFKKAAEAAGPVSYALVVIDPLTEHSRGTGFIRYEDAETAEKVLNNDIQLTVDGVELVVHRARSKNDAESGEEKKKVAKDNRNLYLAREGVVLAATPAAEGVSEGDMTKRLKLEQWKTTVLRNLHMFISPTRLVVHNIPSHYTDKTLYALFKKHSPKGAVIAEARVMKTVNDPEVGKSKGYGFVTYKRHEDALFAVRKINNNPEVFSAHRRPIVAFSVENRKALNIKEKRREMSLKNLHKKPEESAEEPPAKVSNDKRGKKRRSGPQDAQPSKKSKIPTEPPKYSGITAKYGNKKLSSKKQLLNQAAKHRQELKKAKKQRKVSRKQKRMRKSRTSII